MPLRPPRWVRPRSRLPEANPVGAAGLRVRALGPDDLDPALRLLDAEPVENLFLASRLEQTGLDPYLLGCEVLGVFSSEQLVALCHVGSNLVPACADADAMAALVERIGPRRRSSSMMGRSDQVIPLWEGLCERWGELLEHHP